MALLVSEGYLISAPPPKKALNWDRWLSGAAILIAFGAALFSGLQYRASERQARAAEEQVKMAQAARDDAKQAARQQAADVERSRRASEASATAAQALAQGMQRSANAAESSAKTGNESLNISRQMMLLNEQPLLETVHAQLLKPLVPVEMIPISVEVINSGKGPARNIDIMEGIFASDKWVFNFDNNPASHTATLGIRTGGQNPQITITKSISLSAKGIEQIKAGTVKLYVFGRVRYDQPGVGKLKRQSYSYCLYYVPAMDKIEASPFADCPEHPAVPE